MATAIKYPGPILLERKAGQKVITGASIQVEDGEWFKIHNDIADALAASDLSGLELRLLWYLFRQTYGWQRKAHKISYAEFAAATNSSRSVVIRYLNKLQAKNVVCSEDNGEWEAKTWWFNKYIEQWNQPASSDQAVTSDQMVTSDQPVTSSSDQMVTGGSDQMVTQYKDSIKKGKDNVKPVPLTGDPYMDAAVNKFNRRENGQPIYGRQFEIGEWNLELPALQRIPIAEAIATVTGKMALWDADDERTRKDLHQGAITAHKMGYTPDRILELHDAWKASWAGKSGGNLKQFMDFLSEQKAVVPEPKQRRPRLAPMEAK